MPRSRRRRITAANASILVPLRGLFLVGYYTLMRPDNNRSLDWKEITLDAATMRGTFKLDQHKNVNKASRRRGPIARELVEYLPRFARRTPPGRSTRTPKPAGHTWTFASSGNACSPSAAKCSATS